MFLRQADSHETIAAFRQEPAGWGGGRTAAGQPAAVAAPPAEGRKPPKVVAVVVARDRPEDLTRTVAALRTQNTHAALSILIVDSSADGAAAGALADARTQILHSQVNLGGAGGFALGLLNAIAAGAEWIWLMDDDGRPLDDAVLRILLETAAERGLDAVAPAVLDSDNLLRFAFPYPVEGRYVFTRAELGPAAYIPGTAHLFNGLLIRAQSIFKIGLPDLRLFIRGDEIDFMHRMRRAGLTFGTITAARFAHPSSNAELHPVFGGRLHVVYPQAAWKRRNQYRNRAYNFSRHGQLLIMAADFVRYPYFFLVRRRLDLPGLSEWLACTWAGLRGNVHVEPVIDLAPRASDLSVF